MFLKRLSYARDSSQPITRISRDDLKPGKLGQLFRDGVKTVILEEDNRIRQLWEGFLVPEDGDSAENTQPWETSVFNIARNHQLGNIQLGDMLRFVPGHYGSVIRKIRTFPLSDDHTMKSFPSTFWNGERNVPLSQKALHIAWELMTDLRKSFFPENCGCTPYAVDIQLIKYANSSVDLDKMCSLISDAGHTYTYLGHRMDIYRAMASGVFDIRGIRDLFAIGCLIPVFSSLLHSLNELAKPFSGKSISKNVRIIGIPHLDGARLFSALASDRDVIQTEIYDGKQWLELPMTINSLAIFPAVNKTTQKLGIMPTRHRVLINNRRNFSETRKLNITLLLSFVDRQATENMSFDGLHPE